MSCERFRESVPLLAAKVCGEEEGSFLRRHLDACSKCAEAFRQYRILHEALASSQPPASDPQFLAALSDRWRAIAPERSNVTRARILGATAATLAAGALLWFWWPASFSWELPGFHLGMGGFSQWEGWNAAGLSLAGAFALWQAFSAFEMLGGRLVRRSS